jgi:hypothetical protein
MKTLNLVIIGLTFAFAACASTNNGGHVVGNPIISESASKEMKKIDLCECAKSNDAKVKANCACATATATSTSTATKTAAPAAAPKK